MFILVIIIIAIGITYYLLHKKSQDKKFLEIKNKKLKDLMRDGTKVKSYYLGTNFSMFVKENVPILYVLDKNLNFLEYDLTKFDFYYNDHSNLYLMNKDSSTGNVYKTTKRINFYPFYRDYSKYIKDHNVISISDLLSFTNVDIPTTEFNKNINHGDFKYSNDLNFFTLTSSDINNFSIYQASALKSFSWSVGDIKHDYSEDKGRSGAGGAIVGGIAFGPVGAVVGGLTRRKDTKINVSDPYIDNATLTLHINNFTKTLFYISSKTENYQRELNNLNNSINTVEKIIEHSNIPTYSSDQEIQKQMETLDKMLSKGSIAEDYYNMRKAELLG